MIHRNYQDFQVHSTGYVAVMDARWAMSSPDDDGYFLVLEKHPSLRGSVYFCVAWEVLQALVFEGWRSKCHKWACGLEI